MRILLALATVFVMVGCQKAEEAPASSTPSSAPSSAPSADASAPAAPPDLSRPPPVKSAMWSLAVHSNDVATLLAKGSALTPEELAQLKARVSDIGKIAAGLAVDPVAGRHPYLKSGLAEFQNAVVVAEAGLAKDPPDLAAVQALVASCRKCHSSKDTPAPFKL